MWFEARRQEKKLRNIMVDHKKRAERRRQFYERIKKDPAEFMQLHGRQYKVHLEPAVALAAEGPSILRPWQGDPNIFIDRFDARSHLDFIHDIKSKSFEDDVPENITWEERQCSYERYRILVLNDFEKVTEDKFLKQIFMEENFGQPVNTLVKAEEEKKKKLAEQKAAIAFTYDDSPGQSFNKKKFEPNVETVESDELSESEESEPEIDNKRLDVSELTNEQCKELNTFGTKYKLKMGDFVKCLWEDHDEQEQLQSMKDIEDEKAAMAGKHSRRERKLLKEIRIRERGLVANPLSILRIQETKKTGQTMDSSSSSDSSDEDPVEPIQYITSFGGTGSDGEGTGVIQGPAPPPADSKKRLQELRKRRSSSSEKLPSGKKDTSKPKSYSRPNRSRSRSRSLSKYRSRSRNDRRRRSRSSSWRSHRGRRSSSRNGRSYKRSRSRSRSRRISPRSKQRTRSRSTRHHGSKSRSCDRRHDSNETSTKSKQISKEKQNVHNERTSDKHVISAAVSPKLQPSTPRSVSVGSGSNCSMMSVHSDMSDSEQERRQVENTRRRLKKMKRDLKSSRRSLSSNESSGIVGSSKGKNVSIVDKLKLQTQKALKKTLAKDKEEERQRHEDMKREQNERDEELREISILLRKKEREKFISEQIELKQQEKSSARDSRRHRSRSNSSERKRRRSNRRRSRSRSKSKVTKKLVDY